MYDPANNFDDTVNEIVTAFHAAMAIKGEPGVAFEDDKRVTLTVPAHSELGTLLRSMLRELDLPINPVRPGQLPLSHDPGSAILTPDAIRNGKVR